ncbi:hypothetical protein SAMN05444266_103379 [Chitinophaga jiangningensis]|uniref:Uncharacterized protein n=1 Tax=Chitinophaga jiangningensis TaxID=1419482 RepID=A0A1M7AR66_9BACT|nr:hypothetical protein [Chitinophaga jiangningensis]SHL45198.1 hypothetical protein SAMN05444266_103379 [Chitinophaga jiangningensis]
MKWVLKKSNGTDNPHAVELKMKPEFDPLVAAIYTIDYELFPEFIMVISQSENWGFSDANFRFFEAMDMNERTAVHGFEGREMRPSEIFISQEQTGTILVEQVEFNQLVEAYAQAMLEFMPQRSRIDFSWTIEMLKALAILRHRMQNG